MTGSVSAIVRLTDLTGMQTPSWWSHVAIARSGLGCEHEPEPLGKGLVELANFGEV
jgi:hypothetical protein